MAAFSLVQSAERKKKGIFRFKRLFKSKAKPEKKPKEHSQIPVFDNSDLEDRPPTHPRIISQQPMPSLFNLDIPHSNRRDESPSQHSLSSSAANSVEPSSQSNGSKRSSKKQSLGYQRLSEQNPKASPKSYQKSIFGKFARRYHPTAVAIKRKQSSKRVRSAPADNRERKTPKTEGETRNFFQRLIDGIKNMFSNKFLGFASAYQSVAEFCRGIYMRVFRWRVGRRVIEDPDQIRRVEKNYKKQQKSRREVVARYNKATQKLVLELDSINSQI